MNKHIKLLSVLYLLWGAMGALALLVAIALVALGSGLAAMDDPEAGFVLGIIGTVFIMFAAIASLPNLIAGWGLLKYREWARILTIVLCFLNLPAFPFGTALGGYGLWVLFQDEAIALFRRKVGEPQAAE